MLLGKKTKYNNLRRHNTIQCSFFDGKKGCFVGCLLGLCAKKIFVAIWVYRLKITNSSTPEKCHFGFRPKEK